MKMKKWIAVAVAAACAAVMACALVGCGGSKDYSANFKGDWEAVEMTTDGETLDAEALEMMKALGMNVTMTLADEGKGELSVYDEATEVTWEAKSETNAVVSSEEAGTMNLELKDGKIIATEDGNEDQIVFAKAEAESK